MSEPTPNESATPRAASLVEREAKASDRMQNVLAWCFALASGTVALTVFLYIRTFGFRLSSNHDVWNQAGGFFGGILGPTLSSMALLFTVALQREQLGLARTQLADSNAALALSQSTFARQQFEGTFFELLKLTRELLDRFEIPAATHTTVYRTREGGPATTSIPATLGAAVLDSFAKSINGATEYNEVVRSMDVTGKARDLVRRYSEVYRTNPSAFGPYFRCLYQTFKHVSESPLNDADKKRFANIARGQISEGAVLLLALNGLTELGFNFIGYIEEFGLLEHMHRDYLVRHHARAFMGGAQRDAQPMQLPKHGPDFFMATPDGS